MLARAVPGRSRSEVMGCGGSVESPDVDDDESVNGVREDEVVGVDGQADHAPSASRNQQRSRHGRERGAARRSEGGGQHDDAVVGALHGGDDFAVHVLEQICL